MAEPVLSLDTLVERATVAIDGKPHELRNGAELSILDYHRIGRQGAAVEKMLAQGADLSDAQVSELTRLLDAMLRVVLLAPAEVMDRLSDGQKLQVVQAFSDLQRATARPAGGTADAPAEVPSIGENGSPA